MNIYITDESKKGEVLEFISKKTNLFRNQFKIFVVPKILRNNLGKVQYKVMDDIYAG